MPVQICQLSNIFTQFHFFHVFNITIATSNLATPNSVMSSSHAYLHWWTDPSIIESIQEFAHLAGVLIRSASSNHDKSAIIVPVTLRPSKFPCEQFELVMSIQPDLNHLLDAVSRDEEFLKESLQRFGVCVRVCACVCACVHSCVCVHACVRVCVKIVEWGL